MKHFVVIFFIGLRFFSSASNVQDTLVISSGTIEFMDGTIIPNLTFSGTTGHLKNSKLLIWNVGDLIELTVINNDSEIHGFEIEQTIDFGSIAVSDTVSMTFTVNSEGIYRYFDPINQPYNEYLGLNGVVHVKMSTDNIPYFYWDVHEHFDQWNVDISGGASPLLNEFDPNYFTINGNTDPEINLDPIARVVGNIGLELRIVIVNNGLSIHSMHFHGYHLTLLKNSKDPSHEGRIKDTFPLYSQEFIVLSLIPDKEGEYPVHDHNLVAVTGGGIYHMGMFTTLLIAP